MRHSITSGRRLAERWALVMAAILASCGPALSQDKGKAGNGVPTGKATIAPAVVSSKPLSLVAPPLAAPTAAGQATAGVYDAKLALRVYLRVDGNLAGRVGTLGDSGEYVPVRAMVHVIRQGRVVQSARSDEWGAFQILGLEPRVYSVVAVSKYGVAMIAVQVVPYDVDAPQERLVLNLTLIPLDDYFLGGTLIAQEIPVAAPFPAPPGITVPGMTGGMGGGPGAAGLLGLGGLGGLGGLSGGMGPASPKKP